MNEKFKKNIAMYLNKYPKLRQWVYRALIKIKYKNEFMNDYKLFTRNYMKNEITSSQIEYNIMLLIHNLEKGMCYKKIRFFGAEKVRDIIRLYNEAEKLKFDTSKTCYIMAINILNEWIALHEKNGWEKDETYILVNDFVKNNLKNKMNVGSMKYNKSEYEKYYNFDYLSAIKTRHSVRDFESKELNDEDINYCIKAALATPTACNRQMIKIYNVQSKKSKELLIKKIVGLHGFNLNTVNLFVITFDLSALSYGLERNQGYFNSGLVGMNFCNALHFRGIGSCFLQWANGHKDENEIKKVLNIPNCERIAVVVGAGYYKNGTLIPCSYRKNIDEVYKKI